MMTKPHAIHYVDERSRLGGALLGVGAVCDCCWHVLFPIKPPGRMRDVLREEDRVVEAADKHLREAE